MSSGPMLLVVLREELDVDPRELAGPLAKALRRVRYDVLNALKINPWIPFTDLEPDAVRAAASCLAGAGVRAAAVKAEQLPPEPRVFTVHNADALETGLDVQTDLAGRMRTIPWDGIEAISATTVRETSVAHGFDGGAIQQQIRDAQAASAVMTHGMVRASAMRQPDFKPESRTDVYQVLCVMPAGADLEIRFRADKFNYDYLADRRRTNSAENFRILAGDVLARAQGTLVHGWARGLVESGRLPPVVDRHRLARLNQWLRLRARAGL